MEDAAEGEIDGCGVDISNFYAVVEGGGKTFQKILFDFIGAGRFEAAEEAAMGAFDHACEGGMKGEKGEGLDEIGAFDALAVVLPGAFQTIHVGHEGEIGVTGFKAHNRSAGSGFEGVTRQTGLSAPGSQVRQPRGSSCRAVCDRRYSLASTIWQAALGYR